MKLRAPFAVLASAMLVAACSSTTAGSPTPAPATSSLPGNETPPYAGAPKVAHPLPDSALSGSPCEALSPQQVTADAGPGITGKQEDGALGPRCSWTNHSGGSLLVIFFTTRQKEGLSIIYKQVKPQMKRFDELPPIQGFPAVSYDDHPGPVNPSCTVAIGLSDTLEFEVGLELGTSNRGQTDACQIAATVADHAVTTLRQKVGQ
ncbi:DUF3558 domain-containing protein [Amycolatopsis jejuensis]|uniref:DUF3558 domain-containing protein n=1 Tax=Amycolatopsis jejuensis TaxID=330084 RepID=UPI00068EFE25|nr:DUF3558 domain-containing protein [Amycolatopsis jejuensis]